MIVYDWFARPSASGGKGFKPFADKMYAIRVPGAAAFRHTPNISFYGMVSVITCVLPYKHRNIMRMVSKPMKLWGIMLRCLKDVGHAVVQARAPAPQLYMAILNRKGPHSGLLYLNKG